MTWQIDFDILEQSRDRAWEDLLKEPVYQQMHNMTKDLAEDLKPWMQKLHQAEDAEQRAAIQEAMRPLKATRDELIARLAEAFAMKHPTAFIPSRQVDD